MSNNNCKCSEMHRKVCVPVLKAYVMSTKSLVSFKDYMISLMCDYGFYR